MLYFMVALGAILVVAVCVVSLLYGHFILHPVWLAFLRQSLKFGLSLKEQRALLKLLQQQKISNPFLAFSHSLTLNSLISLQKQLDKEDKEFLEKLFKIRGFIEKADLDDIFSEVALDSTRQTFVGQRFTVQANDNETLQAVLVENDDILVLNLESEPHHIARLVNVYFWSNNVGYGFQSIVAKREGSTLVLPHNDALLCRQRRSHKRAGIEIPAEFFLALKDDTHLYTPETRAGFPCQLRDISEGGVSFIAEGKGQVKLNLKVQFTLNNQLIIMCGEVRAVDYNGEENKSTLHIQSDGQMPFEMMDVILSYIYDIRMNEAISF